MIISLNCRKYAMALALAVGVVSVAGAQQPPHQGHETKPGQSHSKMSMPALDDAHFAEMMRKHQAEAWLVNTGWSGGSYGTGLRMKLEYTRAIIDAIHSGELARAPTVEDPWFGVGVPTKCTGVPDEVLTPKKVWADPAAYDNTAAHLSELFRKNFKKYADLATPELLAAGPREK